MSDILNFGRRNPTLPIIMSSESAECGLACLAMVASFHGHETSLNALRQRYAQSQTGMTLRGVMDIAESLNLSTRAIRVELEDVPFISTPAILHWDFSHFVVLKSVKKGFAVVHDPAVGHRRISLDQLSSSFTGIVLELQPAIDFELRENTDRLRISDLWSHIKGARSAVVQLLCLSVALQMIAFIAPLQMQLVIDKAIGHSNIDLLTIVVGSITVLLIMRAVLDYARNWAIEYLGSTFTYQVTGNIVRHLLRLPVSFFERRNLTDITSRVGSAAALQHVVTQGAISAVIDFLMATLTALVLFAYSAPIALVVFVSIAINGAISAATYARLRQRSLEHLHLSAIEQSYLLETIRASTTIKLMGRRSERESGWRNLYVNSANMRLGTSKAELAISTIQTAIVTLQVAIVIYLGGAKAINGEGFSIGMLVAFLAYRQTFSDRAMSLVKSFSEFRSLSVHLDRLSEIASAAPEDKIGDVATIPPLQAAIRLCGVGYRYGSADQDVLKDVDLEIGDREYVAITGSSGGGKTTLLKIMLGLYKPAYGEVFLNGQTATEAALRGWREIAGVVTQDDTLFSGTLADNISFFDADMDMARVHQAAALARVDEQIHRMPMQYQTLVGDMGSSLSGGQRQRILIARALYRNPKILILDEGTANLDPQVEEEIADLIAHMDITRIVVAHRPALIDRASTVYEIVNGSPVRIR